jgi:hypothetical protein
MSHIFLLVAMVLSWIAVIAGTYQRIFEMPKWFANPPLSFELIRQQSRNSRRFWIPLSTLFMISVFTSLVLNWQLSLVRSHLIMAIVSFGLAGALSGIYFIKEIIAFTKIPVDAPSTPELLGRVKFWLKWTSLRDILQFLTATFITIAYIHSVL